jgi:hypothetical protein
MVQLVSGILSRLETSFNLSAPSNTFFTVFSRATRCIVTLLKPGSSFAIFKEVRNASRTLPRKLMLCHSFPVFAIACGDVWGSFCTPFVLRKSNAFVTRALCLSTNFWPDQVTSKIRVQRLESSSCAESRSYWIWTLNKPTHSLKLDCRVGMNVPSRCSHW